MDYKAYWDRNIAEWGEHYLEISHGHEALDAPPWLSAVYKRTIGRLEARLMRERYRRTVQFLHQFVGEGTVFADIGCGTGIFTVEALRLGAEVIALDFSEAALDVTMRNVEKHATGGKVTYVAADMQRAQLPRCDVALAMGVTPYVADLDAFLGNILPSTNVILCQYTSPSRPSNILRRLVPALNVRKLIFHSSAEADRIYAVHGFELVTRKPFATGFIDLAARQPQSGCLGGIFSA